MTSAAPARTNRTLHAGLREHYHDGQLRAGLVKAPDQFQRLLGVNIFGQDGQVGALGAKLIEAGGQVDGAK